MVHGPWSGNIYINNVHTAHVIKYLYFQQRFFLLADVGFFLQQAVPPQQGLQGCGLPRGHLALGGQLGF